MVFFPLLSSLCKNILINKRPFSITSNIFKGTGVKWQKGSLFERVNQIENKVENNDSPPYKFLFPHTSKRAEIYIPENLRCGVLAVKLGLTHLSLKEDGSQVLCTMVQIKDCEVLRHFVSTHNDIEKHTIIVGACDATYEEYENMGDKSKQFFSDVGMNPKLAVQGFQVHVKNVLRKGTKLNSLHYVPGQRVSVVATTRDRGFLGTMQRWNFKGQPASHGNTKCHRAPGSICNMKKQVAPRTKMAGHTGLEKKDVRGMEIMRINTKYNILYLRGIMPGKAGEIIAIRDWWGTRNNSTPPYPTASSLSHDLPEDLYADHVHKVDEMFKIVSKEKDIIKAAPKSKSK